MNAICGWGHGIITYDELFNHQVCGACAGDEPFYVVKEGITEDTVRCMYCPCKFNIHGRAKFWEDEKFDYVARLECKTKGCLCNRFIIHPEDKGVFKDD